MTPDLPRHQGRDRRPDPAALVYRPPRPAELVDCADIWHAGVSDYLARLATQAPPLVPGPFLELLGHLQGTDPDRFLVAVEPAEDRVLGWGAATRRDHVWFLAMLFVHPDVQAAGIGRTLLARLLPGGAPGDVEPGAADRPGRGGPPGILATCTDSAQPISNGLYAGHGIVPRLPLLELVGHPGPDALPELPAGIRPIPAGGPGPAEPVLRAMIDAIDRRVLGYAHPQDHAFLRRSGRSGQLFLGPDGAALGYGYASPVGRLGPIAVLDETLTAPILGHLLRSVQPRGAFACWVPGVNDRAVVALLRAGLRFEGFPSLLCATRPFGAFERYVPIGLALL